MSTAFSDGNRRAVPATVNSRHFFYLAQSPCVDANDLACLADAARAAIADLGLNPGQIEAVSRTWLGQHLPPAAAAFDRVARAVGFDAIAGARPCLLVCEWAMPHTDESFAGQAFVSLVVHTGPAPYVVQSMHTERSTAADSLVVQSETRVLEVGRMFVLDPTTPHMAVPLEMRADELLVLMQLEVADETEADRAALLERYPPRAQDHDQAEIFNGYGFD